MKTNLIEIQPNINNNNNKELLGCFFMTLESFFHSIVLLISQYMYREYPVVHIHFHNIVRGIVMYTCAHITMGYYKIEKKPKNDHITFLLWLRVIYGGFCYTIYLAATQFISLSKLSAYCSFYPLICCYLSALILKEVLKIIDHITLFIFAISVLIIFDPFNYITDNNNNIDENLNKKNSNYEIIGIVLCLLFDIYCSLSAILQKTITKHVIDQEVNETSGIFFFVFGIIMTIIDTVIFGNYDMVDYLFSISFLDFIILFFISALTSFLYLIGRNFFLKAVSLANITKIMPFYYSSIIFGTLFDFIMNIHITVNCYIGVSIIFCINVLRSYLNYK